MTSHRVVSNGRVYEVEDGKRPVPRGADEIELLKCGCAGNGCEDIAIDFTVTYLLASRGESYEIFAFIAGDEMALYREHGLLPATAE